MIEVGVNNSPKPASSRFAEVSFLHASTKFTKLLILKNKFWWGDASTSARSDPSHPRSLSRPADSLNVLHCRKPYLLWKQLLITLNDSGTGTGYTRSFTEWFQIVKSSTLILVTQHRLLQPRLLQHRLLQPRLLQPRLQQPRHRNLLPGYWEYPPPLISEKIRTLDDFVRIFWK